MGCAVQELLVEEQEAATSAGQIKPDQMIAALRAARSSESISAALTAARGRPLGTASRTWKHWDAAFVEREPWVMRVPAEPLHEGPVELMTYVACDPCHDYAKLHERPCIPESGRNESRRPRTRRRRRRRVARG